LKLARSAIISHIGGGRLNAEPKEAQGRATLTGSSTKSLMRTEAGGRHWEDLAQHVKQRPVSNLRGSQNISRRRIAFRLGSADTASMNRITTVRHVEM